MIILLLEALAAVALFGAAIWWTMFSGRDKGELRRKDRDEPPAEAPAVPESDADTPPQDAEQNKP